MSVVKIIYLVGTISFGIMCGIGHLMFELLGHKSGFVIQTLEGLSVSLPGKETNMLLIDTGLSLVMGLMLFAYGVINLMIIVDNWTITLPSNKIIIANIIFSLMVFFLVYKYLFIAPVVFVLIGFVSFSIVFIFQLSKTR